MQKDRKDTNAYLVGIKYKYSMNKFHETFGDSVTYAEIEQQSYIDLKQMTYELVSEKIKFRKFERDGMTLILKVDMTPKEFKEFKEMNENKGFNFIHDYEVSKLEELKK